ncbi:hypothetical protein [Streptacidiphilus sp. MAP5-3]|uniref:hypothetical protein n=1 Tax=unclassified Streptacidiphilus TaxID=2643834 RepID=UPI00351621B8
MDGWGLRLLRAVVFAALSVMLPVGARLAVTGQPVPVDVALLALGGSLVVALLLFAGERGYRSIVAVLVPLQVGMNVLFNTGQQSCPPGPVAAHAGLPGWGMLACGGGTIRPGLLGLTEQTHAALVALTGGQAMLLLVVHLVLALAAAWWLRRGEAALFALVRVAVLAGWHGVRALLVRLSAPVALPEPSGPRPPLPAPRSKARGPQDVLPRTAPRRGPPMLAQAC